ncbi:MAG TPA: YtxH domain-containing protein, partial [Bradyrhizobium sp.]|nr:YtxH domain-containing protein [Bradyrhizobium sp.]
MADQTFKTGAQTGPGSSQGFEKAATTPKSVTDQAISAGRDVKDKALGLAAASSETIKNQASEFVDAAKDVASEATDKLKQTVDSQKSAGADYVGSLAGTIRRAAKEFDGDLPIAGSYIRKAASQVEGVADTIRTGNFKDLVRGAQSFARRQPTAFLGIAVLAGFGVVRFLKSSANEAELPTSHQPIRDRYSGTSVNRSHDSTGYRDEF